MLYVKEPKPSYAAWDHPEVEHLDGVPWFEAPLPKRRHKCWVQTRGWLKFECVERCACGAIKRSFDRRWIEKNASRKSKVFPDPPSTPYIERKQAEIDQLEAVRARFEALVREEEA